MKNLLFILCVLLSFDVCHGATAGAIDSGSRDPSPTQTSWSCWNPFSCCCSRAAPGGREEPEDAEDALREDRDNQKAAAACCACSLGCLVCAGCAMRGSPDVSLTALITAGADAGAGSFFLISNGIRSMHCIGAKTVARTLVVSAFLAGFINMWPFVTYFRG